jgi:hypothetical protein
MGTSPGFEPELVVLFLGASVYYDLHVHSYDLLELQPVELLKRFWPGLLLSGSTVLCFLHACSEVFLLVSAVCLLAAAGYSLPLFHSAGKRWRMREWPVLKVSVVGLAYAAMTVTVPAIDSDQPMAFQAIAWLFMQRALFIACLCIPFEIRDQRKEHDRGVPSLMDYGLARVRRLSLLLLMFSGLSGILVLLRALLPLPVVVAEIVVNLVTMGWILTARVDWPSWKFTYLVDGTMLLPPFLIILLEEWL